MPFPRLTAALGLLATLTLSGCDWMPGKPKESDRWKPKSELADFTTLYRQNCLACHSDGTSVSASIPMNDPVYLNILPRETLRAVIVSGVPGTTMPAFSAATGGPLTDKQIDILVDGIFAWKSETLPPPLPPHAAPLGDVASGAETFGVFCASCHGPDGKGGPSGSSVVEPAYLGLVSDQYLRTVTIVGRPQFGMPDWRGLVPNRVMTDQEISDVTAWLASHRITPTPQPPDSAIR